MQKAGKKYPSLENQPIRKFEEAPVPFGGSLAGAVPFQPMRSSGQMTAFEKMELVRKGVSKTYFEGFKQKAGLDYDQLAVTLSVARATLINKKGVEKFNPTLSEKIISLADIYAYGYEVFESVERFNEWVFRPNRALGGLPPYDFLDNQFGREEVKNLIGRIDYGVYS